MNEQKKTAPPRRSYRDLLYSIHRVLMLVKYGERGREADEEGLTAIEKLMEENGFSFDQPSAKTHGFIEEKGRDRLGEVREISRSHKKGVKMRNLTEEELRWIETFDGVKTTDPWLHDTENGLQGLAIRAHKAGLLSLAVDRTMSVYFPAVKALLEDFTQK